MDSIFKFGNALIRSRDLDPVYCALYGAQLLEPVLSRLLLAYLSFYHLGLAAWLSEHEGEATGRLCLQPPKTRRPHRWAVAGHGAASDDISVE